MDYEILRTKPIHDTEVFDQKLHRYHRRCEVPDIPKSFFRTSISIFDLECYSMSQLYMLYIHFFIVPSVGLRLPGKVGESTFKEKAFENAWRLNHPPEFIYLSMGVIVAQNDSEVAYKAVRGYIYIT